ncbi:GGDEF domain-containing response regulator [Vallitalea okinawensis]|uniref:GGDEF domain-containing response regulator n=1 Tax=Vallitalea okinawensis TaxID=2078660 RepID=UPI000CFE1CB8|nr:diguanylate cyclase [Vallitalea okinawensis]
MNEKVDILIVDDKKENHLVMESVLTDKELNLVKAISGEEALKLCLSHSFAVILMDVQMPNMDGFEAARLLRSIEKTKHIPIIFVTAISKEQKSIFRGYEVGAVDYLFKPFDPIILRSKVNIFKEMYLQRRLIEKQAEELAVKVEELNRMEEEKQLLESISMEDSLTQTYNRRGYERLFNIHWKNCARYHLPLSLILLDMDHFKNYNDHYGHVSGDEVLKDVSNVLMESLMRSEDFVGRFGGEEFIIVLPNTPMDGALLVADRINDELAKLDIKHEYNDDFGRVTVSMGIAMAMPSQALSPIQIIDQADELLYKAKNSGRNRYMYKKIE